MCVCSIISAVGVGVVEMAAEEQAERAARKEELERGKLLDD